MTDQTKRALSPGDKHLLRLVQNGRNEEGWSKVSGMVWPLVIKLPPELVELRPESEGGFIRLTQAGELLVQWL